MLLRVVGAREDERKELWVWSWATWRARRVGETSEGAKGAWHVVATACV